MAQRVWEPLVELELDVFDQLPVYCLCSRSFARTKFEDNGLETLNHDTLVSDMNQQNTFITHIQREDSQESITSSLEQESETSGFNHNENILEFFDNGDHFTDLSANFAENHENKYSGIKQVVDCQCKSELDIAWEKFWLINGKSVIWKTWIEKYRAYINPSYFENNSFSEYLSWEYNELQSSNENANNKFDNARTLSTEIKNNGAIEEENCKISSLKVTNVKISTCSSLSNLSEPRHTDEQSNYLLESNANDKIFKSNSFGSYRSYKKVKMEGNDNNLKSSCEGTWSRSSNTSLLGKSIDNMTGTTDSMTNVTKITLSSLDLTGDSGSTRSNSLLSTPSEDYSGHSSVSASSHQEEIFSEVDASWQQLWKEHYEEQYNYSYQEFASNFNKCIICTNKEKNDDPIIDLPKNKFLNSQQYFNSIGYCLQRLEEAESKVNENNDSGFQTEGNKEVTESNHKDELESQSKISMSSKSKDLSSAQNNLTRKIENVQKAMTLVGLSFKPDMNNIKSGRVTYRKRNIRFQNKRLKFGNSKVPTHLFFDDEGKASFSSDTDHGGEKKKMKMKKKKTKKKTFILPPEIFENKNLVKYWRRRYELFSKFDKGVKLDAESWFSVTPELLAKHHAERCRCDVMIDAFCGAGGNSIQFAYTCERVIAIDIDPYKIELAKHNARIYGVEERIEFIVGDFTKLACKLQGDVVFLSPPWGGPNYQRQDIFKLDNIYPMGGEILFHLASGITDYVAFFLPKNADTTELALLSGPGGKVEIEQNFLFQRLKAITAYFGGLVMDPEDPYL